MECSRRLKLALVYSHCTGIAAAIAKENGEKKKERVSVLKGTLAAQSRSVSRRMFLAVARLSTMVSSSYQHSLITE